jgi:hypothetical protein
MCSVLETVLGPASRNAEDIIGVRVTWKEFRTGYRDSGVNNPNKTLKEKLWANGYGVWREDLTLNPDKKENRNTTHRSEA